MADGGRTYVRIEPRLAQIAMKISWIDPRKYGLMTAKEIDALFCWTMMLRLYESPAAVKVTGSLRLLLP